MSGKQPFFPSERTALGVILGYFGLHVLLRTLVSGSMQLDEAEQFLLAQDWSWGYGSQPPLYTWLQRAFIGAFGTNVFALALLKNVLLCGIFIMTFLVARRLLGNGPDALLAGAGLLLFPGLTWESQRDQTHLVLATFMAAATLYVVVHSFPKPSIRSAALLGLLGGLGLLSKYNFAVFLVALMLAALSLPTWRSGILTLRMLVALLVCVAVVLPHLGWAWTHAALALSQSGKFQIRPELSLSSAWLKGASQVAGGILENAVVPVALFGLLSLRGPKPADSAGVNPQAPRLALVWRTVFFGLGLSLCCVLAFQVTNVKARWFQPLLFVLPVLMLAHVRPRLSPARQRILFLLAGLVMVVVPAIMYGGVVVAGWTKRLTNLNVPYNELSARIRQAGFTNGLILAENRIIGGNLKLQFPDSVVAVPEVVPAGLPQAAPVMLAWKPGARHSPKPALLQFAASLGHTNLGAAPTSTAIAPSKYARWHQHELCFAIAWPPTD